MKTLASGAANGRFAFAGPTAIAESDVLSFVLGTILGAQRAARTASLLIRKFGSCAAVFAADPARLACAGGAATRLVATIAHGRKIARWRLREMLVAKDIVGSPDTLGELLAIDLACHPRDSVRLICVGEDNRMICDLVIGEGRDGPLPHTIERTMRVAVTRRSTALILVQTRLTGDVLPSAADTSLTETVRDYAALFGMVFHDHVIVAPGQGISLRAIGLV